MAQAGVPTGQEHRGATQYVYLPTASGPMPVAAVINGVVYAVHSDHLNTPRRITSGSGQVMWQWAYSAFGETAPTTAAKRFAGPETVPTSGTTTATPVTFNLRYPGQYADSETGLFYNANRTYDPRTGRYTQPDPTGLDAGWNLFAYPIDDTRPVSETLASIQGHYTTVYGYTPETAADPWQVYDQSAPAYVRDLATLSYGKGYWINVSEPITLLLRSNNRQRAAAGVDAAGPIPTPPATFYGAVRARAATP